MSRNLIDAPTCDVCGIVVLEAGKWRHPDCTPPTVPLVWCSDCSRYRLAGHVEAVDHALHRCAS